MSAREVKVHFLTGELSSGGAASTVCGKIGWKEFGDEYSDAIGNRFEATAKVRKVTCKSCRRAADGWMPDGSWAPGA